ncbi:MAG: polymer-forming cytoskeletal protein [Deltaproteobacteria bacterium]|nr:polymer-forming cytoskeletal protein [Deltaproteobacteria bacterium]MBW2283062.1 polymer-forming cytoskeletal protein [Deltaproteobacteria bacterium]
MKKDRDQINAFLGRKTEFEGKLIFDGTVRIDGRFRGEIVSEGTLVVGETATLECDIRCAHIVISGEVRGNIDSQERIEIRSPGKVFGNIQAPVVVMGEGVVFDGYCRMRPDKAAAEEDNKVALLAKSTSIKNGK